MSRDSRQLDSSSDRFAEQLSDLDAGMQLQRPDIDWRRAAAKRCARRQLMTSISGSLVVLLLVGSVVWLSSQPFRSEGEKDAVKVDVATFEKVQHARIERELVALNRELTQLDRSITSFNRRERSRKATTKIAVLQKTTSPLKSGFSDPVEEGALVMLAAAEKASQKDGRDAALPLYRRVVEIFPETRSAEIARRNLM